MRLIDSNKLKRIYLSHYNRIVRDVAVVSDTEIHNAEVIEAIPVEWIEHEARHAGNCLYAEGLEYLILKWRKECLDKEE